jgi:pimeloyl-ACP methyl ester carboxylesterase
VLAVVDAIGADDLVAAGHSKGGAALLLAEARRPGTFRSLYLFEPIVFPPVVSALSASGSNPLAEGARRRRPVFDSYAAAYDNYHGKPPFSVLHPDALRAYVDFGFSLQTDGTVRLKCRPEVEAEVFTMGGRNGAWDHLAEVTCPVTVAVGRAPRHAGHLRRADRRQLPTAASSATPTSATSARSRTRRPSPRASAPRSATPGDRDRATW